MTFVDRFDLQLVPYQAFAELEPSINEPFRKLDTYAAHLMLDNRFYGTVTAPAFYISPRSYEVSVPDYVIGLEGGTGLLRIYPRSSLSTAPPAELWTWTGSSLTPVPAGRSINVGGLTVNGTASVTGALGATSGSITSTLSVGTTLTLNRGQRLNWTDTTSCIWINTDQQGYWDLSNSVWNFRDTAASSVARFQIHSGGITVGGSNIYWLNSSSYWMRWTGTDFGFSHSIVSGGNVGLSGNGLIYIGGWDGTYIHLSHSLVVNGAFLCLANNANVHFRWDGTWMQCHPQMNVEGARLRSAGPIDGQDQVCGNTGYDAGAHRNGFLLPNWGDPLGLGLATQWREWSCVDHAFELGLRADPIKDAAVILDAITGYYYDHTTFSTDGHPRQRDDGSYDTYPEVGFAPSQVAEVLPMLVGNSPFTGEPECFDYGRLVPVLWEAVKSLRREVDSLKGVA